MMSEAQMRYSEADKRLMDFIVEMAPKVMLPSEIWEMFIIARAHAVLRRFIEEKRHETQATY